MLQPSAYPSKNISRFLFNDLAPADLSTLSLHDALPISFRGDRAKRAREIFVDEDVAHLERLPVPEPDLDRKSTRLNSSHLGMSYAVFCLKKQSRRGRERVWRRRSQERSGMLGRRCNRRA